MSHTLIEEIKRWLTDFEKATPDNFIDENTLDGSAYYIFQNILSEIEENRLEESAQEAAYNHWLYS